MTLTPRESAVYRIAVIDARIAQLEAELKTLSTQRAELIRSLQTKDKP